MSKHSIDKFLTLENIYTLQQGGTEVELSEAAIKRIKKSREFLENKLKIKLVMMN